MDSYAHQACIRCRKQKRRCTRLLPVCARCSRLNLRCSYPEVHESCTPDAAGTGVGEARIFRDFGVTGSDLTHAIQMQVSDVIGGGDGIAQSTAAYFSTVHVWFPIIDRDAYHRRLEKADPPSESSLLTLCMCLITIPSSDGMSAQVNGLYMFATTTVSSLTAAGVSSLQLLQSRLLLSLFEVGHGMYPAAYISIGANVRAAEAMGIDSPPHMEFQSEIVGTDDAYRLWLGLIILDRYISLEIARAPSIPIDISDVDERVPKHLVDLHHASALLEKVLSHIHSTTPYEQKAAEAIPILENLSSFRESRESEIPVRNPATALCSSAFMTILEFGYRYHHPTGRDCSPLSFALLEAEVQQFVEATKSLLRQSPMDDASIPVFSIHSIGKAGILILQYLKDSQVIDIPRSLESLKMLLRTASKHWHAAGMSGLAPAVQRSC
ncbi:uncharacterized protein BDV17DRAFT_275112 [Aspergillus undulatus]|uniref:uncharacterized protein n=1 Tax=Aspergillus undulatus TaxID=1810928 RepID=UPI003CCDBD26